MRQAFHDNKVQQALKLMDRRRGLGCGLTWCGTDATPFGCCAFASGKTLANCSHRREHDYHPLASFGGHDIKVGA